VKSFHEKETALLVLARDPNLLWGGPSLRKRTVLIVEDDEDVRESLQEVLEAEGYATAQATNGQTALAYLRTSLAPGLILLDWNMAPMNGSQFVAEMARDPAFTEIPLVLMSAEMETPAEARGHPFASSLTKPVQLGELLTVVRRYCDRN
jgi:CheY-like chemotaxis protein